MQSLIELWIAGLAMAMCLFLRRRLPMMVTLRWWFWSWSAAVASLVLGAAAANMSGGAAQAILVLRALFDGAQLSCAALGLLQLQPGRRLSVYGALASGFGVMLFFWARLFAGFADEGTVAAAHGVAAPIVCGVLSIYFWPRLRKAIESLVSAAILLVLLGVGLVNSLVLSRLAEPAAGGLLDSIANWPGWNGTTAAALAFAMALIALLEVQARHAELFSSSERLRALVDSAPCAICEIDSAGTITLANRAAARTLAREEQELAGAAIQDIFEFEGDDLHSSTAEHTLRPTAAVEEARGVVRRSDGEAMSIEWSVAPLQGDNVPAGGVVVLRDVTQHAAVERFLHIRSEVLEMIARNKSIEQISKLLASAVEERIPGCHCSVLVCDGDWFRMVASRLPDDYRTSLSRVPSYRLTWNDGVASFKSWDRRFLHLGRKHGFRGTWVEPMTSAANEVLGAVVLNDTARTALAPEEKRILEQVAKLGALAVEHRRTVERLTHQGHHDALTGLPNRVLLEDRLKQGLARAERGRKHLALLAIDLDRFKYVNDTFGHDIGDLFLQQITVRLSARIRASDTLARTGGDEFTAIIGDIEDVHDAETVAQSLTAALADPFDVEGHTLYGAVSIGVAVYPEDGRDAESLRRNADRALYRAKAKGRNTIQCYSCGAAGEDGNRLEIEVQLHRAIEQGNFEVHYQPQFTCDRQLIGFEALLRFRHPKLGMVPPSHFIPIAEECGLILPIGEWVLHQACRQIKEWEQKGMHPVRVAVNGSPLQFAQPDFCQSVEKVLQSFKVRPDLLELEVTEGMLMQNVRDSAAQMQALASLGVKLSVDDFGTGYSSLSYLHQLPIHVLKIDRSFVAEMLQPAGTRAIVEAIISLAHGLGLKTIAEGVENEHQLAVLKGSGCDYIQGYVFSRPLPAIAASRLLWESTSSEMIGGIHPSTPAVWIAPRSLAVS